MGSIVLCYFSGDLPTPHFNLSDFSLSLCGDPDKPSDRESERKDFLKRDRMFAGFDKGPRIGVLLLKHQIPPIPTNPTKCFERPCHSFNFWEMQTPQVFSEASP